MDQIPDHLLRWPEVQPLVGNISRSTAWRRIRAGKMPKPIRLDGINVWRRRDIAEWQAGLTPNSEAA